MPSCYFLFTELLSLTIEFTTKPSLDTLVDDCMTHILSFLPFEDLNLFAICNQRCCKARSHPSLDQTRTGTIVYKETSNDSVVNAMINNGWEDVFSGNRSHLRIVGIEALKICDDESVVDIPTLTLEGVTSLTVSRLSTSQSNVMTPNLEGLLCMLPNLRTMEFKGLSFGWYCADLIKTMPYLIVQLNLPGSSEQIFMFMNDHITFFPKVTDISLNECRIVSDRRLPLDANCYMFKTCTSLKRLSIKNVSLAACNDSGEPLPQEWLIDTVRRHSTLRWLRSDLTAENTAMVQQERPEIAFVSSD